MVRAWAESSGITERFRTWAPTILLTVVAAAPRLIYPGLAEYKLDESTAVLNAELIIHQHAILTQGQGSSLAGAAQGPLFYYFVALVLAVGRDPRAVVLAIGLANALAIGFSYRVVGRAFNARIGLLTAVLFAGSSWSIVFSRKIWPNDLLAPLAIVALWGLFRAIDPRTDQPGLGWSWLAVATMGSLNLSAWPLAAVPALVHIVAPRTRRGRALVESLAGIAALGIAIALEAPTFAVIFVDLTAGSGQARTLDLSPLSYIVQLVGTDAFQYLAGPLGTVTTNGDLSSRVGSVLRLLLFLGIAVSIGKSAREWLARKRPTLTPSLLILLWWLTPAVAAIDRPVPVYIHHFLATFPAQFILVAMAIDWIAVDVTSILQRRALPWGERPESPVVADSAQGKQSRVSSSAAGRTFARAMAWLTAPNWAAARFDRGARNRTAANPDRQRASRALGTTEAFRFGPVVLAGAFVVVAFFEQIHTFARLLDFVQAHPTGTYFGIPLDSSLVATRAAQAVDCNGPVYILSDGDLVGVDGTPTVIASLAGGAGLSYLNADQTLLLPATTAATYFVAPDTAGQLLGVLASWQSGAAILSPMNVLPGGYREFRGRPIGASLPDGWTTVGIDTADGGKILGYRGPRQIQPGATFEVDVVWRVGTPARRPDRESVFAHLVNDKGQVFDEEDFAPLPTSTWVTGDGVLNRFQLTAPRDLSSGRYWVEFGRYRRPGIQPVQLGDSDNPDGPTSIRLGPLAVPPSISVPANLQAATATFGGQISLTGWRVTKSGTQLSVGLLWNALKPPSGDYTVFVHLTGPGGEIVAQSDSQPLGGEFPTSTWTAGNRAYDVHELSLEKVPPGDYQLSVGLYTLATGQRLPVGTGDAYPLGPVKIPATPAG